MSRFLAVVVLSLGLGASACGQGEGDICQVTADCSSGLECNAGTMRCQRVGTASIDAAPQLDVDAGPDAAAADAGVDAAPPDAAVDAQ